jgi:hypothetical protein
VVALRDEKGKPFWGTRRYLNKKMLRALAEELGHGHEDLLLGSSFGNQGDRTLLLESAAKQVAGEKICLGDDDGENSEKKTRIREDKPYD